MPELRTDVEIIEADVSVEESLAAMSQRALVVLNCVGPVSTKRKDSSWKKIFRTEIHISNCS